MFLCIAPLLKSFDLPRLHERGVSIEGRGRWVCEVVVVVVGVGVCLPLVDGAVTAVDGVCLGIFQSVQDGLVLPVEGNAAKEKE